METRILPRIVTLRVIGACNLRCPFCFGPRHELGPVAVQALAKVIARLPKYGVEGVSITGGEPLMVRQLPLLLRTARELGLEVNMSTNGILLRKRLDEIAPHLNWIGLPLDGDCPEANERMRVGDRKHFALVPDLIPLIRERYPQLTIKVGTVATALNKDHIAGIPAILSGPRKPDVWKIYRVVYSNYGNDNRDLLALSDEEFEQAAEQATRAARKHSLPVMIFRPDYREGNYLLFEPTGEALAASGHTEISIGNFLTDFDGVVARWQEFVTPEQVALANAALLERFKSAFREESSAGAIQLTVGGA